MAGSDEIDQGADLGFAWFDRWRADVGRVESVKELCVSKSMSDSRPNGSECETAIHSNISCRLLLEVFDYLSNNLGALLDFLLGTVFLRKAHLAFALETPFLKHLLTFLVFFQAR